MTEVIQQNKIYGIIYRAYLKDGRSYIGQTTRKLNIRISEHKSSCKYKKFHFQRAIKKYGFDSFNWEILEYCLSLDMLNKAEIYWSIYFKSIENGFNLKVGEGGGSLTDETKRKISEGKIGEKNPMFGKNTKMRGKKLPNEWKNKIKTKFQKGQIPWNKGIKEIRKKRLTITQLNEIYSLYDQGVSIKDIAEKFHILRNSLSRIISNRDKKMSNQSDKIKKYEIYNQIYEKYLLGESLKSLCLLYNCNENTVRGFIKREKKQ